MKPAPFEYRAPETLPEALCSLAALGGDARVLAGGENLMPLLNLRRVRPAHIVDINGLASPGERLDAAEARHRRIEDTPAIASPTAQRGQEVCIRLSGGARPSRR